MNNNWRGNGEAVFTFSGLVGRRTDSVPHSRLSELITEQRGEGRVAGRPGGRGRSSRADPEGSGAAPDSAGTPLHVRPDVQAPAACL